MLRKPAPPAEGFAYPFVWPGTCPVPEAGLEFTAIVQPFPDNAADNSLCALLDAEALPPTLTIRSRRPGDRYGGPGHRKLKRMLLNARLPEEARAVLPLVAAGESVIWAPGFLPAKTYRAAKGCRRCVKLDLRPIGTGTKL
jgi:tRNA(Ile)-lysidine synthase